MIIFQLLTTKIQSENAHVPVTRVEGWVLEMVTISITNGQTWMVTDGNGNGKLGYGNVNGFHW